MADSQTKRLAYLDWLRGLACAGMFEVHCYDSWLGGAARNTSFFRLSQFIGTAPAPLFIFLSGVSCAFVADRMLRKGAVAAEVGKRMIRRGAEIFALALLFRLQEYILGIGSAPWTDLLRVDVLNLIGVSIVLLGVLCWVAQSRLASGVLAACAAVGVALLTPPLWTTHRPHWLPWYLESYVNGVHIYNSPQPWLFAIFPWSGFAFAGLATGMGLFSDWPAKNPGRTMVLFGVGGTALFSLSLWLDARFSNFYAVYDYWHTSPNFFLARVGFLLVLVPAGYVWCRWGFGSKGFSPLIQLGQTSLLVYWVHIEFVYGHFSILTRQSQGIVKATLGLIGITAAMVLLSIARTRMKGRGKEMLAWFNRLRSGRVRSTPPTAAES